MDPGYIKPVDRWLGVLLSKLKPLLYENGGPIILTQLENEYGSFFTCDKQYLGHLRDTFRANLGENAVLITTDGAGMHFLKCGAVDKVYATVDFGPGSNVSAMFAPMRQWNSRGPLVNSEYYTGWLDHWGGPHANTDPQKITDTLEEMLKINASVNFYMFIGGTNFGFMNGVNGPFSPVVTSYDYDAPLSEAGDITSKYTAIRNTIAKYKKLPQIPVPPSTPKYAYGPVHMKLAAHASELPSLLKPKIFKSKYPLSMEQIDQNYGFIQYQHKLKGNFIGEKVQVDGLRDRGYVFVDGKLVAVLDRTQDTSFNLIARTGSMLVIFVENLGRINFGNDMINQSKGIIGNVTSGSQAIADWEQFEIDIPVLFELGQSLFQRHDDDDRIKEVPAVFVGKFVVPSSKDNATFPMDSYLAMPGWFRGQAYINGHNLGRYWPAKGPQMTMYVPKGVLLPYPQKNVLLLFEFDFAPCFDDVSTPEVGDRHLAGNDASCQVKFVDQPVLNRTVIS